MSCTVKVDGPCRRTLSFEIERRMLDDEIESRLGEIGRTTRFKGFRPGKVPTALVRRTHGKRVADEARRQVMGKAFAEAVKEHSLRPVGDPVMNLAALEEDTTGPLSFEFEVEVAPEFELVLPDRFAVTVELAAIDESMVDGEVKRLRERFGRLEEGAEGAAVGDDDLLEVSVVYEVDGEQVASRSERPVFLRHGLVDGIAIEGAAAAFTGRQVGDTVELQASLPERFEPKGWEGREASVKATIDRHRVLVVPELDQQALATLGVESEEQLRERVAAALEGQRNAARDGQIDRAVEQQLADSHEFELPERLLAKSIDHKVHELAHRLMKEQGLSSEDGHHTAEARRDEITEATRTGLRLAFLVDAIARNFDLAASVDEAIEQIRAVSSREGSDPDQTIASAIREGWLGEVQEQLSQEKVRAWLRGRVDVTETAPAAITAE